MRTGADAFTAGLEAGYGVVAAAGFSELAVPPWRTRVAVALPERFRATGAGRAEHLTRQGIPSL